MIPDNFQEKVLESKTVFRGRILTLRVDRVQMANGTEATREIIEHFVTAVIVPITENNEVILTRQFRLPTEKVLLEVPAGRIEKGETALQAAHRELREETGFEAETMEEKFSGYSTPGFSNELMHFFIARGLKQSTARPDEDEYVEVVRMPLAEALQKLERGEFQDAKTILGLLLLAYAQK